MKSMTLSNIHEWPLMTRVLMLGLVFAATFYIGYRFDLAAQMLKLTRAQQQEVDLKEQVELTIRKNKMIQADISRLPALQAELETWTKQLIGYKDLPELLNDILKVGGDNHLFFSLFTPGESTNVMLPDQAVETTGGDAAAPANQAAAATVADQNAASSPANSKTITYAKVPIKVVVVGNYHQIADFISQLANMPYIIAIGNFTITNENQTTVLGEKLAKQAETQHLISADMMLDVYYIPESK